MEHRRQRIGAPDWHRHGLGRWYEPRLVLALPKPENEMADALVNLFEWCKRERERLQMQREMLQSGRFRIHENDGSGQRDLSDQHITRLTDNIAELDGLIADYEARRPSR